jgi:hypothetical protein
MHYTLTLFITSNLEKHNLPPNYMQNFHGLQLCQNVNAFYFCLLLHKTVTFQKQILLAVNIEYYALISPLY